MAPYIKGDHSIVISFNNIVFVIGSLQGFKLCAQKTEVVEMDEISKFKFDLIGTLGHVKRHCNSKTRTFHLK